jgi:hypothetical protein
MNDDDKVIQMILYHTQNMRTWTLLNDELRKIIMSDRHRPTPPVAQDRTRKQLQKQYRLLLFLK